MVEPVTTIGLGAVAAYLAKDGLEKLLGPTADYMGAGLKDFTQKRSEAIGKIFQSAYKKLGDKVDQPGEVPPKVLKSILNEGSFSTDPIAVEYFGGILASSRTEHGRDDRSARIAKTVDGLSTYQLRAHYLIYSTIRKVFLNSNIPLNMEGRPKMQLFITIDDFIKSMEFDETELNQLSTLMGHIFFGLHSDSLIEGHWQYGPKESMIKIFAKATSGGIIFQPSALGAELFLSAFGYADKPLEFIFDSTLSVALEGISEGYSDAIATN